MVSSLTAQTTVLNALLMAAPMAVDAAVIKALKQSARQVQNTARNKFGTYQPSIGPFPGWAVLSTEYIMQKASAGDDPLIGFYNSTEMSRRRDSVGNGIALKNSIETKIDEIPLVAYVGTDNILGRWHEYGLPNRQTYLPPRPFLRPALYQNKEWINQTIRDAIGLGMVSWFK